MTFAALFLVVAAGLIGPAFSGLKRFALPMVAGEILAGIIIGNSGLHWINAADPSLQFLSNVGFSMLLFLVGARIMKNSELKANLPRGLLAFGLSALIAVPLAFAVAYITGLGHVFMFVLLGIACSTSTIMPILAERKLGGPVVNALSTWIPIADMSTMVLLPLALGKGSTIQIIVGAVVVNLVGMACFFALRKFKSSPLGERYRQLSKDRHWALDLRLQLLTLFGLAALANVFGTSILVAGFTTGAISAKIGQPNRFKNQLVGIAEGLFVPLFFVITGARINVRELVTIPSNLELTALILVAGLLTHLIVARIIRLPLSAGLIAAQQMGLPAAVVALGLAEKVLTGGQAAAIIAAALLSLVFCSIGTNMLARSTHVVPATPKPPREEDDE